MRLLPILLFLLPLALLALQLLWYRYRVGQQKLRSRQRVHRPPSTGFVPWSAEVDLSSDWLFGAAELTAPLDANAYWLVFDTETRDAIGEEVLGEDGLLSFDGMPLISLAWQVLDEAGRCMHEEYYLLRCAGQVSRRASAIHGLSQADLEEEGRAPREVLARFLRDAERCQCLVAHHLRFHRAVVEANLQREGLPVDTVRALAGYCTMEAGRARAQRRLATGQARYPKLRALFTELYGCSLPSLQASPQKGLWDMRGCVACLRALVPLPCYGAKQEGEGRDADSSEPLGVSGG